MTLSKTKLKCLIICQVIIFLLSSNLWSQSEIIELWPKGIPNSINNSDYKEEPKIAENGILTSTSKVSIPTLSIFLADPKITNGSAVVIFPGGGYKHLSMDKEGSKIAKWFNSIGISAFVLKYRLPSDLIMKDKRIGPLQDAQEAIRMVRRNASKWKLDPNKIGIIGFSAGGHLASTLSTQYNERVYEADQTSAKPDFSILMYPVISMDNNITHLGSKENLLGKTPSVEDIQNYSNELGVDENTPATFLVHASDDGAVLVENSINYYKALKEYGVTAEMHVYEDGGHGFGLGRDGTNNTWPQACEKWLKANDIIPSNQSFVFTYFKGNGEDGLHLAYSRDGLIWNPLNNDQSVLIPRVGKDNLMRDPCIIKGGDGMYHMVWTVSWTDKGIGYANSPDLIHWSEQQFLPVMTHESGTRNTWAPEITYDQEDNLYMIYWSSTIQGKFPETQSKEENGYNHRIYYTTTKNFKTFADTKLLYEPGFNVIDASIVKNGNSFLMFLKNETRNPVEKNIRIATANNLTGPYSQASTPITGDYWAEGPTALERDGVWRVYFDKYIEKSYGAVESSDLKNWKDISENIVFPKGARHGTVIQVDASVLNQLITYFK